MGTSSKKVVAIIELDEFAEFVRDKQEKLEKGVNLELETIEV